MLKETTCSTILWWCTRKMYHWLLMIPALQRLVAQRRLVAVSFILSKYCTTAKKVGR